MIYSDSEIEEDLTIRNFRVVQTEGFRQVTCDTKHYSLQIKNIFEEGELNRKAVVANFATTASDGKTYQVD